MKSVRSRVAGPDGKRVWAGCRKPIRGGQYGDVLAVFEICGPYVSVMQPMSDYSDYFAYVGNFMSDTVFFDFVNDFYGDCGVEEISCAYLHRSGTGHKEFQCVASACDSAESDHRDFDGFGCLPHHAHCHWAHCRSGEALR